MVQSFVARVRLEVVVGVEKVCEVVVGGDVVLQVFVVVAVDGLGVFVDVVVGVGSRGGRSAAEGGWCCLKRCLWRMRNRRMLCSRFRRGVSVEGVVSGEVVVVSVGGVIVDGKVDVVVLEIVAGVDVGVSSSGGSDIAVGILVEGEGVGVDSSGGTAVRDIVDVDIVGVRSKGIGIVGVDGVKVGVGEGGEVRVGVDGARGSRWERVKRLRLICLSFAMRSSR